MGRYWAARGLGLLQVQACNTPSLDWSQLIGAAGDDGPWAECIDRELKTLPSATVGLHAPSNTLRKTKRQQLKGKIVSALFHTFPHFSTLFLTFFTLVQKVTPRTSLKIKACLWENKKKKTRPFCTLVVARFVLHSNTQKHPHAWGVPSDGLPRYGLPILKT